MRVKLTIPNSWFVSSTYKMLTTHNMAFYLDNLPGQWPPKTITADFVDLQLHEPAGPYEGLNDDKGYAVKDARIFKDMVQKQTT